MLDLGILGPVRAVRAGRDVALGGPKQRAVLALLLIDAGRVVPAEYLAEVLWRGSRRQRRVRRCVRMCRGCVRCWVPKPRWWRGAAGM